MHTRQILEAYFAGPNNETFEALYEATRGRVWTLCYRILRNNNDAQDALQGVYARLHAIASSGERAEVLRDYDALSLTSRLAILEAQALSKRRARRLQREFVTAELPDVPVSGPSAKERAAQRELRAQLETAVARLPEHYAVVIQLHFFHELSRSEIGSALGVSAKTVSKRIERALERLEPILRRAGMRDASALHAGIGAIGIAGLLSPPNVPAFSAASIYAASASAAPAVAAKGTATLVAGLSPSYGFFGGASGAISLKVGALIAGAFVLFVASTATLRVTTSQPGGATSTTSYPVLPSMGATQLAADSVAPGPAFPAATPAPTPGIRSADSQSTASLSRASSAALRDFLTTPTIAVIHGRVTDIEGRPLPDARIESIPNDSLRSRAAGDQVYARTYSAPDGSYRLRAARAGYVVRVSKAGYAAAFSSAIQATLDSGRPFAHLQNRAESFPELREDFQLQSAQKLTGTVRDSKGHPIAGARVQLLPGPPRGDGAVMPRGTFGALAHTAADGSFVLSETAPGLGELVVSAPGFSPLALALSLPHSALSLSLHRGGGGVSGTVSHRGSGLPVAGARVSAQSVASPRPFGPTGEAIAAADGTFSLEGLAPGTWFLAVSPLDPALFESKPPTGRTRITLAEGQSVANVELLVDAGVRVRGRFLRAEDQAPIPDAYVVLGSFPSLATRTGRDGSFAFPPVARPGKEMRVSAATTDHEAAHTITLENLSAPDTDAVPAPAEVTLLGSPARRVIGCVRDEAGRPVPGARVSLAISTVTPMDETDTDRWMPVQPDGSFQITGALLSAAAANGVRIVAMAEGYALGLSNVVVVRRSETANVSITLHPKAALRGRVLDADSDRPLAGIEVKAYRTVRLDPTTSTEFLVSQTESAEDGSFSLRGIQQGLPHGIHAVDPKYSHSRCVVEYAPPAPGDAAPNEPLVIRLHPSHFLEGRVIDPSGNPVPDVQLRVGGPVAGYHSSSLGRSDSNGRFLLNGIPSNRFPIKLSRRGFKDVEHPIQQLDQTGVEFLITPDDTRNTAAITGEIIDATSKSPVLGATVRYLNDPRLAIAIDGHRFRGANVPRQWTPTLGISAPGYPEQGFQGPNFPATGGDIHLVVELHKAARIRGRVLDANGNPTPRVSVRRDLGEYVIQTVSDVGRASRAVVTGADGRFTLDGIPGGSASLRIEQSTGRVNRFPITVPDGSDTDLGDFRLDPIPPAPALAALEVTLLGPADVPLANETIRITPSKSSDDIPAPTPLEGKTNPQGLARFDPVPSGTVGISCAAQKARATVQLVAGETARTTLRAGGHTILVRLSRRGAPAHCSNLTARSVDGAMLPAPQTTDEGIEYRDVPAGTFRFSAYQDTPDPIAQGELTIEPKAPFSKHIVDLKLHSATLSGVVRSLDGQPVQHAFVTLLGEQFTRLVSDRVSTRTNSRGEYSFRDLPACEGAGVQAALENQGAGIVSGLSVQPDADMVQDITLDHGGLASIESLVIANDTRQPDSRAWMKLTRLERAGAGVLLPPAWKRTADGIARVTHLVPGDYEVEVSSNGYSRSIHRVTLVAGKTTTLEDVLYPAGSVTIAATISGGRPAPAGISVECKPLDPDSLETQRTGITNAKGRWEDRAFAPGPYRARFSSPKTGALLGEIDFTIRAKDDTKAAITLRGD